MSTQFSALVSKLKEIFQINRPDLDFGVYRILNARSTEIAEFLDKRLKTKVEQYLGEAKSSLDENVLKELEAELKAEFGKRAFNEQGQLIDAEAIESALGQKYIALTQADAHEMTDQSQVYSHLLTFFSRYYDDGDFISQRRYKGDTYAIPYSGEEVMLHWANKDQYYTKSGEMFSNYRFKLNDERSVLFRLVSADTARENRKDNDKDRRFIIVTEPKTLIRIDEEGEEFEETIVPFSVQNNELTILFEYQVIAGKVKQEASNTKPEEDCLNKQSELLILSSDLVPNEFKEALLIKAPTQNSPNRTILRKHLSTYTQKNTADYFIHKDLGKFLRHELDFYIKNEVMQLDDVVSTDQFIQIERQLSIIKCLRQIGLEIISFLASLEDFQKKLWLKKKFVVSAEYCITLDRVDESLYAEIADNTAQWQQWEDLGFKGKEAGWGTVDYLKQHQALMVDTSLFGLEFKAKLLQKIDDLDAQTDGLIINSDNFQALSLLKSKYQEEIKCIYIDPPYNTGADGFLYKDNLLHSSWCSMINEVVQKSYGLLAKNGVFYSSIDDNEVFLLRQILDNLFSKSNFFGNLIWRTEGNFDNQARVKVCHEYILSYAKNIQNLGLPTGIDPSVSKDSKVYSPYILNTIVKNGSKNPISKVELPKNFPCTESELTIESRFDAYPFYHQSAIVKNNKLLEPTIVESGWSSKDLLEKYIANDCKPIFDSKNQETTFHISKSGAIEIKKKRNNTSHVVSILQSLGSTQSASSYLMNIGINFSYPKPNKLLNYIIDFYSKDGIVLDFFAGSGTTAQSVIELNKADKGQRKYLLVEQSEYFNSVIKPRIQKVVYSADWKEGKPINPESGISHCLKVVKLESYEDTLNNLELVRKGAQQTLLAEQQASTKPEDQNAYSDYLMHYMLELESKDSLLNVKDFLKPFSYQMNITTDSAGAFERKNIDLVETFNYLIGLNVQEVDYQLDKGYAQITGKLRTGEYTTVLWRDCDQIGYAELDQLLSKLKINPNDGEYQLIYINGDHNVASKYTTKEGEEKQLKVRSIEQTFLKNMFEE